MSNKTAPILAVVVLGAAALTPVFIKSFGDNPQVANIGNRLSSGISTGSSSSTINTQSPELKQVGYSIGYILGTNVKNSAKDVNLDDVKQGLNDGFGGKQSAIPRDQMEKVVMAYQQKQVQQQTQDNLAKGQAFLAQNAKKAGVKTTASGLQYEVLKEGNATKPKATDIVAVQYEGKLIDGKVFDSSAQHGGQPAVFPLNQVIPGWTEGVQLMGEGAKYRFYVPSNLGYGEQGMPQGGIEPNSVLIFDVELVKVNPPADNAGGQPSADDIQAQLKQQIEQMQQQQAASQPK